MNGKKITREGTPRLVAEETMKEVCDLLDALLNLEFSPAGGGELVVNGKKAVLRIEPGALAAITPFKVVSASTDTLARVRVYMGFVNDLDPVSQGPFSAGDAVPKLLSVSNGNTVYVRVSWDYDSDSYSWQATGYTVLAGPMPSPSSSYAYYPLKSVAIVNGAVQLGGGVTRNLVVTRCGEADDFTDNWGAGG
jgi:hypothetical protein